jgi:hypothetical protein
MTGVTCQTAALTESGKLQNRLQRVFRGILKGLQLLGFIGRGGAI